MTNAIILRFILCLLLSLCLSVEASEAGDKPDLMVVLGDSLSAATLAGTYLGPPPDDRIRDPWGGDGSWYENRYAFSWFSGVSLDSQYMRLKKIYARDHKKIDVFNIAEPGAESTKLEAQGDWIRKKMSDNYYANLVYVGILIGANDACNPISPTGYPETIMTGNIKKALDKISKIKQSARIKVLISSLPMIPRILEVTDGHSNLFGQSCRSWYNSKYFYCKTPLLRWKNRDEERVQIQAIEARNEALEKFAIEAAQLYPSMDIFYSDAFSKLDVSVQDIAGDCFHANTRAQAALSEAIWRDQPWFK